MTQSVEHCTCDQDIGVWVLSLAGQVIHSCLRLSPSSIIW